MVIFRHIRNHVGCLVVVSVTVASGFCFLNPPSEVSPSGVELFRVLSLDVRLALRNQLLIRDSFFPLPWIFLIFIVVLYSTTSSILFQWLISRECFHRCPSSSSWYYIHVLTSLSPVLVYTFKEIHTSYGRTKKIGLW